MPATSVCRRLCLPLLLALPLAVAAQTAALPGPETPDPSIEHQRQQQRTEALRRELERSADVRRPETPPADVGRLAGDETPCFQIREVTLTGADAAHFPWLAAARKGAAGDDPPEGRCLGSEGIRLVLKRLQNALLERGYLTSRVSAPNQDLSTGTLAIAVHAGRIEQARFSDDSPDRSSLRTAVPVQAGAILNLRDLEQTLENLKRVPSADADIEIHPAATAGASDLVVRYRRASPLHITLAADDGGLKATGKHQGSATFAYDNPFGLNDLVYLALSHDLEAQGAERGTWGALAHYSVPFGYWTAALTLGRNRDRQTVVGATTRYIYGGYSNVAELNVSRLVHRDGVSKSSLSAGAWRRSAHNFIDDTEVEVQRRQTGGWQVGANHRRFIGTATLDATLEYKRGTGAFGALPAPEELFGEGTSRFRKSNAELRLDFPFRLAGQALGYAGHWRAQWAHSRLNPQELFSIGGRYTVRGFDGESLLSGERGWLWRNEVVGQVPGTAAVAYLGLDYGEVGGPTSERLPGKRLAGAAVGLRASFGRLFLDVFVGAPVSKPKGFDSPSTLAGFRLAYSL